jgi:hypothetical protein
MRHEDLPLETQKRLEQILELHRKKVRRVPRPGDCFFLNAPTTNPEEEPDHALVAGLMEEKGGLVCVKISLEYWLASEHDYMLDPQEWGGGYTALVEVWNAILIKTDVPTLIHATIPADQLQNLIQLFLWHQRGESPPKSFRGVGKPMPENPEHPLWQFRAREAEVMERARRHLHEGWDVAVVSLPTYRHARERETRMAASSRDLSSRLEAELEAQRHDRELVSTPQGNIFLRWEPRLDRWILLWFSPEAGPPPEVEAAPPLEPPQDVPERGVQVHLGFWPRERLEREALLRVRTKGFYKDILVQFPRKRR